MAKTIQEAGGQTNGGALPTSQEITATKSIQPAVEQAGSKLANDLFGIMGEGGKTMQAANTASVKAAERVASDNRTQLSITLDTIKTNTKPNAQSMRDAQKANAVAYQELGRKTFDNEDAQRAYDKDYHDVSAKAISSRNAQLELGALKLDAHTLFVENVDTTSKDYDSGMKYTPTIMSEKVKVMESNGYYTKKQGQTELSNVEIESFNDRYKLFKDLDIYVEGSNFEIDSEKLVAFYNDKAFGAQSKMKSRPVYDGDGKKTGEIEYVFEGTAADIDSDVVNSQRDAFIALIQKAKSNTAGSLATLPSPNKDVQLGSDAIAVERTTYDALRKAQIQTSKRTGMKISDSSLNSQDKTANELEMSAKKAKNYERAVTSVFTAGGDYATELKALQQTKMGYTSTYYVDGQPTKGSFVAVKQSQDEFNGYVKREVDKYEKVVSNPQTPIAERERAAAVLTRLNLSSHDNIKVQVNDSIYQNTSNGTTFTSTLQETHNLTNLSYTIGMSGGKTPTSNWVLEPTLKDQANLFYNDLQEELNREGTKLTEADAIDRYNGFVKTMAIANGNLADTRGSKVTIKYANAQDGDIVNWSPSTDRVATGTPRLLRYDGVNAEALSDKYIENVIATQTMPISNDWFGLHRDNIIIRTPDGAGQADKNIVNKIFGKLAIKLGDTKLLPDDFDGTRLNISQAEVNKKVYTYASVVDSQGRVVAFTSFTDADLIAGMTKQEQQALKELNKHKRKANTNATLKRKSSGFFLGD